jgi:hypothetical protein
MVADRQRLISNTWDTEAGRFGLLANFSYSQVLSRADGLQISNFQTRDGNNAVAGQHRRQPGLPQSAAAEHQRDHASVGCGTAATGARTASPISRHCNMPARRPVPHPGL